MPAKPPSAKGNTPMSTSDWLQFLRDLADLMETTALTEIELEDETKSVRLSTNTASQASYAPLAAPAPSSATPAPASPASTSTSATADTGGDANVDLKGAVRSPMVGTVYLAPEPGAANFVSEGDKVKSGQTLLIIEAMKVMNPITAPKAGVVKKVLVENAQPVEFDQPLITLE